MPRLPTALTVVLLVALSATACTSSDDHEDGSATVRLVPDETPTGMDVSRCSPAPSRPGLETRYGPTATAAGDLVVTGVELVGPGVRLQDAQGVLVDLAAHQGTSLVSRAWPLGDQYLPRSADPATRSDLLGMAVADGEQVMPIVRLAVDRSPESEVTAIRLHYRAADQGDEGTVELPLRVRFPGGPCPTPGT